MKVKPPKSTIVKIVMILYNEKYKCEVEEEQKRWLM